MRARTHRHARMARVIGRRLTGSDAVVVETADRLAYCVAGRPHTIVVTTGALTALDPDQLEAVLAHERAHLTGRHHLLLAAARGLAAALPRMRLFRDGAVEIARLLEMCADDIAARDHGRRTLLGGLLALTGAPAGALGAGGEDVLARADRLTTAVSTPAQMRARTLLSMTTLSIAASPLAFGVLSAAGVIMCGPTAP
ncbi:MULTISPECIES: M56 family metallopeptidase [unclassified Rhodococcus (in: high G+C Gram-positive bacteria)]|uniref:M56 family metallopeptidase n=1 Tax=unclassified Rhodococcus (in: high G+C Gram-positive bacteria) TaxID=192944 RepID=UPI00163A5C17|nr:MULTISPECIES: M56 family metallopeptidase [unclassified Rhodococcus (in: high G+C Gram-positive bacteria)]MBC2644906.1 M56 family metallopeptidase [Rhodococcus sp. 3A]MBC2890908.1 M56 family metallopeptidase [Rhodococcus sp. 4CII]